MTSISHLHEIHLQVLRTSESRHDLTQRELAKNLGVFSLGKARYCMKTLIKKGLVKMEIFSHSQKKLDYPNFLTPIGIKSKAILKAHFIERKAGEYVALRSEIGSICESQKAAEETVCSIGAEADQVQIYMQSNADP